MYKKILFSIGAIMFFAIIAGSSFEDTDWSFLWLLLLLIPLLIGAVHYETKKNKKLQEEEKKKNEKRLQLAKQKDEERFLKMQKLKEKLSEPTKIIKYNNDYFVMINENTSQIMLNEHIYKFQDIINYNLTDSATVIQHHETGSATTKTNTKSMVGRAVVGDVLFGGAGAVAGAMTAKKNTEIKLGDTTSTTKHDYSIIVNVNSISNPVERLHLGQDGKTANEILGVLSVIVTRNK